MQDLDKVHEQQQVIWSTHKPVHAAMYHCMANEIPYQVVLGAYKGELETSFVSPFDDLTKLHESGLLEGQETIITLGRRDGLGRRKASLIYLDTSKEEDLGYLTEKTRSEALAEEGWTFNPALKAFFVAAPQPEETEQPGVTKASEVAQ